MTQPAHADPRPAAEGQLRQGGRALLLDFYTALRSLKLYPVENATVQKALDDLAKTTRAVLAIEIDLEIRLAGDFIFVNATRLRLELDNYASFSQILVMLRAFEIGALRIHTSDRREWRNVSAARACPRSRSSAPSTTTWARRSRSERRPSGCTPRAWR